MKYILKPFFKIFYSLLLSIIATIAIFFHLLVTGMSQLFKWLFYIIWEFKFNRFDLSKFSLQYNIEYDDNELASVYHDKDKVDERRYQHRIFTTKYKTPYHYIWGIMPRIDIN